MRFFLPDPMNGHELALVELLQSGQMPRIQQYPAVAIIIFSNLNCCCCMRWMLPAANPSVKFVCQAKVKFIHLFVARHSSIPLSTDFSDSSFDAWQKWKAAFPHSHRQRPSRMTNDTFVCVCGLAIDGRQRVIGEEIIKKNENWLLAQKIVEKNERWYSIDYGIWVEFLVLLGWLPRSFTNIQCSNWLGIQFASLECLFVWRSCLWGFNSGSGKQARFTHILPPFPVKNSWTIYTNKNRKRHNWMSEVQFFFPNSHKFSIEKNIHS